MTPEDQGRADGRRFLRAFCDPSWGAPEIDAYLRGLAEGQRAAPEQHRAVQIRTCGEGCALLTGARWCPACRPGPGR